MRDLVVDIGVCLFTAVCITIIVTGIALLV